MYYWTNFEIEFVGCIMLSKLFIQLKFAILFFRIFTQIIHNLFFDKSEICFSRRKFLSNLQGRILYIMNDTIFSLLQQDGDPWFGFSISVEKDMINMEEMYEIITI